MYKSCNFQENEQIFNFNSLFEMCENLKLCEAFYGLTREDNGYKDIMDELKSLSSCSEQNIPKSLPYLTDEYSILSDLVMYVYMSQCSYKKITSIGNVI